MLVGVLQRLVTERAALPLLGVGTQLFGVGVSTATHAGGGSHPTATQDHSGYGFDVGAVAGMVASAATAAASGVGAVAMGMMGADSAGLSSASAMKLQW